MECTFFCWTPGHGISVRGNNSQDDCSCHYSLVVTCFSRLQDWEFLNAFPWPPCLQTETWVGKMSDYPGLHSNMLGRCYFHHCGCTEIFLPTRKAALRFPRAAAGGEADTVAGTSPCWQTSCKVVWENFLKNSFQALQINLFGLDFATRDSTGHFLASALNVCLVLGSEEFDQMKWPRQPFQGSTN